MPRGLDGENPRALDIDLPFQGGCMTHLSGRGVAFALCLGILAASGFGLHGPISFAAAENSNHAGLQINSALAAPGEVALLWTAPGDDGQSGRATGYDLRCVPDSSGPIDTNVEWNSAELCTGEPMPSISGQRDSITVRNLTPGAGYYFCIRAYDEAGNYSGRSNSPLAFAGANAPLTPALLSPANGGTIQDYSPALDWSDVTGADYYQVQIDNNSTFASPERSAQPIPSTFTVSPDLTGGAWYWRVRVNVDSVFSTWSSGWNFILPFPPPSVPIPVSPANGSTIADFSPLLDWGDVAGADSYQVQVDNGSGFTSPERIAVLTASQYIVTPDLQLGSWYWRVRACDNSVYGNWCAGWSFILADNTPPSISGVQATNITSNSASIAWNTNEPATSQVDYGPTVAYGSSTTLDPTLVTAHSQNLGGLISGTLYHYRVRSRDAAGNEAVGVDNTFTTLQNSNRNLALGIIPTVSGSYNGYNVQTITDGIIAPRGGTATTWASDQSTNPHWIEIDLGGEMIVQGVGINWAWNQNTTSWMTSRQYMIQRWDGSSFVDIAVVNNSAVDSIVTTNFNPANVSRLRIFQPSNMGPQSYARIMWMTELEIWGVMPDTTPPPSVPIPVSPANGSTIADFSPLLDWGDVAGADSYQVQVDNGSGFTSPERIAVLTASQYIVTPDLQLGSWYWRVRACDNSVYGNWCAGWSFILADNTPPTISGVQATNITSNSAAIAWNTNEPATSQVDYGPTVAYGSSTSLDPTLVMAHNQSLGGLMSGTLYHYRVRSRDAAGNEAVGADYTFTTLQNSNRNLALGIIPTVSGSYNGYNVQTITDGVIKPRGGTSTTWASDQSTNPHWIEIDFGGERNFNSVIISWAWNLSRASWMTSRQYMIQRWDGSSFVDIITVNNTASDSATATTFTPITASRIRIYQPSNMGPQGNRRIMWLTELEVWEFNSGQILADIPGDVNGSGHLDGTDLVSLIRHLKNDSKIKMSLSNADVDGSGQVNSADVDYLRLYFRGSGPAPVATKNAVSTIGRHDK
jgi:hypothetical protein